MHAMPKRFLSHWDFVNLVIGPPWVHAQVAPSEPLSAHTLVFSMGTVAHPLRFNANSVSKIAIKDNVSLFDFIRVTPLECA